ncbi:MAG: DPP IV N-terminal domain-containing protein [Chloroflexota bacterium]|nr:DPP IV N-terminal domain-containing protein [Chloroflexota bacterium]
MKIVLSLLLLLICLLLLPRAHAENESKGWLVTSRRTDGQADLWAVRAEGGPWQRLTRTAGDERWPTWHPAGHTLAYAARRERNWDIYTLDLRTGKETRLTKDAHFDGWPAWSPDGTRLAFVSARAGDLDLFLLDWETGKEHNLTPTSPAHEFEPRWEDTQHLLFVSTRAHTHDIYRLDVNGGTMEVVTETQTRDERAAMPRSDGKAFLVISVEDRARTLRLLRSDGAPLGSPFSWTEAVTAAALSDEGNEVAWLEHRFDGDILYRRSLQGGETFKLNGPTPHLDDLAWGAPDDTLMERQLNPPEAFPFSEPPEARPSELVRLDDVDTVQPFINERALIPFRTVRARVLSELGDDFLAEVSETVRPVDFGTDDSDYLSWHKAGRAVDTLLDLGFYAGQQWMEIVREDWHGDVYWRIWLRCPVQDGSCGEPLIETPWDYSYRARWELAPGKGGVRGRFQAGYYVDFTRLAEDEGWERIASYETPNFDWRQNKVAMEYWHYQYTDNLPWYDAMREIYTPQVLEEYFGWEALLAQEIPRWILRLKGVPLPPEVRRAPAEIAIP